MKVSIKRSGYDPNGPRVNDPTLEGRTNRPRFTKRRREAAIIAIDVLLEGKLPDFALVSLQEDLIGARAAIEALADRWK